MKTATMYHCQTVTEATDRANLYYIASPTATGIQDNRQARQIQVTNRKGKPLAVFQY